jgi:CheY-like chemotaxis protein
MLNSIEPIIGPATLEALPKQSAGRRALRSSAVEPPEGDEELIGWREFSASQPSRLPLLLEGVRVLVVDDDEDAVELFASALTACGADVVTSGNAAEAIGILAGMMPDVVVSDIAMPSADGYWLLREIRELSDVRARILPVVAVTAYGREHVRARALAAGFFEHLEKPVDPEVLCRAIARAANR